MKTKTIILLAMFAAASNIYAQESEQDTETGIVEGVLLNDEEITEPQEPVPLELIEDDILKLPEELPDTEQAAGEEYVVEETAVLEQKEDTRIKLGVEGVDHDLTEKYRQNILTPRQRKWLVAVLERGAEYRPYIRLQLEKRGMPEYLEYLPIVESEFKVMAKSRSGASGIWQFMENSMKPYLTKSTYVDERYDPWKATDAALSKLQENYRQFGDWLIAIAAYNCGAGAMARILKNSEQKDFWYLAENKLLKNQSIQYVPKLLAISDLVINKDFYELDLPELPENWREIAEQEFDYISMENSVTLGTLAAKSGVSLSELVHLNPELILKQTPFGLYKLRIRPGTKETVMETLKSNGAITKLDLDKYELYKIAKGDTLWGLSRKRNTTVGDLQILNNLGSNDKIFIGQTILLPIVK